MPHTNTENETNALTGDASISNGTEASPRISVVIAAFNAADCIRTAIDSVAEQTWPNKELLIADGQSKDETVEIIQEYAERGVVNWWQSESDYGISDAWNKAVAHATGDWIYFLGADDRFWAPDTLARIAPQLRQCRERVAYGRVMIVTDDNRVLREEGRPWEEARERFLEVNTIPHQGTFHHRSLFEGGRGFNLAYRIAGDYDLLLGELKSRPAVWLDQPVAAMRAGGMSATIRGQLAMYAEFERIHHAHHIERPAPYLKAKRREATCHLWLNRLLTERGALAVVNAWRRLRRKPLKTEHR